ncbi:MAG: PPC domain-containing protein [Planctomycetes bacterium]|nr:PPC domain-containing protein [Planctomycetota bacterium]
MSGQRVLRVVAVALASACGIVGARFDYVAHAAEQPMAVPHEERYLVSVFPAGGQQGTTVDVEFASNDRTNQGDQLHGLKGALDLVIEGAPGITFSDVTNVSDIKVKAKLAIAKDAVPGRRMIRVRCQQTGITNYTYFTVGSLPEVVEVERNNETRRAQEVTLPVVVNGRVSQTLDVDYFKFTARKGQKLVAAALAYDFDSRTLNPRSYIDVAMEVLDADGRVVADAADVLGLDPLAEFVVPADGTYFAGVKLVNYQGYASAVYRLTLGEVPLPTALFPVAVRRGQTAEFALSGPNMPADAKFTYTAPQAAAWNTPATYIAAPQFPTHDLPILLSDLEEVAEAEPNDDQKSASPLKPKQGVSGRFDKAGDVDWYRLALRKGDRLRFEVHAQRYLRSGVDTHLALLDAQGNVIQENDDAALTDVEQIHDFDSFDSSMNADIGADGDYYLRVTEQTGTFGPRAVYHVSVTPREVDVALHAWPDAVPIWGPGATCGFYVTLDHMGAKNDVELRIEGLPEGWQGSTVLAQGGPQARPRVIMTITAPPTAKPGDVAEFQVIGRFKNGNEMVEKVVQPMTTYMGTDKQFCRISPKMRVAVGQDLGVRLSTDLEKLVVVQGQNAEIPITVSPADFTEFRASVNLAGTGFRCSLGVVESLPLKNGVVRVPVTCNSLPPGIYPIVVSLNWGNETRRGMPGPCTKVVHLHVTSPTAAK